MWNSRFVTTGTAMKRCGKCRQLRAVTLFPKDRSKPDGLWHSYKFCSRRYWRERGKHLRKSAKAATQYRPTLTGLRNLRRYHSKDREPFAPLPPELRPDAIELLSKYVYIHRRRMTGALYASLCACAASNVQRLGDKSWARRLWAKKGQYRKMRRQIDEQAHQDELRSRRPKARVYYTDLTGI